MFGLGSRKTTHITLTSIQQKELDKQINMVIGQLRKVQEEIQLNDACDETLTQVLASRGGLNKLIKELISFGILDCLKGRNKKELTEAISNLVKSV